jgi:exosortase/archaeosortase family protein
MEKIKKVKLYFKLYTPVSYYLLVMVIIFPFYPLLRQYFVNSDSVITQYYGNFLSTGAYVMVKIFGIDHTFLDTVFSEGYLRVNTILMAIWQTIMLTFGCLSIPVKFYKRIIAWFISLCIIWLFNISRIILIAKGLTDWPNINVIVLNGILVMLLNLICLVAGFYWFRKNYALKKMFLARLKFNKITLRNSIRNIFIAIGIIIIINFLAYSQVAPLISVLSLGVINASHFLLSFLGYHTEVVGRLIQNSQAAIVFSDSCLGLELFLFFATFIAVLGGKWQNKLWYITVGILILYLLNILRISLIFIYLVHNQGKYELAIDIHDIYTYSVYIVTFILWAIWINQFTKPVIKQR